MQAESHYGAAGSYGGASAGGYEGQFTQAL